MLSPVDGCNGISYHTSSRVCAFPFGGQHWFGLVHFHPDYNCCGVDPHVSAGIGWKVCNQPESPFKFCMFWTIPQVHNLMHTMKHSSRPIWPQSTRSQLRLAKPLCVSTLYSTTACTACGVGSNLLWPPADFLATRGLCSQLVWSHKASTVAHG